jgi:hypothetical protein
VKTTLSLVALAPTVPADMAYQGPIGPAFAAGIVGCTSRSRRFIAWTPRTEGAVVASEVQADQHHRSCRAAAAAAAPQSSR